MKHRGLEEKIKECSITYIFLKSITSEDLEKFIYLTISGVKVAGASRVSRGTHTLECVTGTHTASAIETREAVTGVICIKIRDKLNE